MLSYASQKSCKNGLAAPPPDLPLSFIVGFLFSSSVLHPTCPTRTDASYADGAWRAFATATGSNSAARGHKPLAAASKSPTRSSLRGMVGGWEARVEGHVERMGLVRNMKLENYIKLWKSKDCCSLK